MKKLLLILSAVIVCVAGWATEATEWNHAHPYAYGLRHEFINNNSTIRFHYTLNANALPANGGGTEYNNFNSQDHRGVQIVLLDESDNTLYEQSVVVADKIDKGANYVDINIQDLPISCWKKSLKWMVRVWGAKSRTYAAIVANANKNPNNAYGIAVNNDMTSPDFGKLFVSEAYQATDGRSSMLEFGTNMVYNSRIRKNICDGASSYFSGTSNYEPHRIKISEDGRVFVTCYHPTAAGAVLEYIGNETFKTIVSFDKGTNGYVNGMTEQEQRQKIRRIIGMDVKGKGKDLKILCAWIDPDGSNGNGAVINICEYLLGKAEQDGKPIPFPQMIGQSTNATYSGYVNTNKGTYGDYYVSGGLIYSAFKNNWNCCKRAMIDVAYGANDDVWLKVDYGNGYTYPAYIVLFRNGNKVKENKLPVDNTTTGYYGGSGILYNTNNNSLITAIGAGNIVEYKINADNTLSEQWRVTNFHGQGNAQRIGWWSPSLAMDKANNLYAIGERGVHAGGGNWDTGGTGNDYSANIISIAMPYSGDGKRETIAQQPLILPYVQLNETMGVGEMNDIINQAPVTIAISRSLQSESFNTICLPFDLDVNQLDPSHPYYNATIMEFDGVTQSTVGDENVLELNFTSTGGKMESGIPYLIQPQKTIQEEVLFNNVTNLKKYNGFGVGTHEVTIDNVTFWGILPQVTISSADASEVILILVSDNRLAQVFPPSCTINGFRAFIYFDKANFNLPENAAVRIVTRKPTPTSVINLNGEQVDVEKFLREGRVYIRMGETLYTITGEIVE